MWVILAFLSAALAGVTSVLAKCGIKETDSTVATAIRTIVVWVMAIGMVWVAGSWEGIRDIRGGTWGFLVLSGVATGASWLCYFKALQLGDINKVVPIDKSSTVLAILLAWLFLKEDVNGIKVICMGLIGAGIWCMIEKKESAGGTGKGRWLIYAVLSAVFAALTSLLSKIGLQGVEANLGTAIRTAVVLVMAWLMVFVTGKEKKIHGISAKERMFIILSGLATGASWLCYYKALQEGPASIVVPIDKLSILVTVAFSRIVFGERLSKRGGIGLVLMTAGTLGMLIKI